MKHTSSLIVTTAFALIVLPNLLSAQNTPPIAFLNSQCYQEFKQYRDAYRNAMLVPGAVVAIPPQFKNLFDMRVQAGCATNILLEANVSLMKAQIFSRLFLQFASVAQKQAGSSVSGAGSTNLVSKNLTSSLLSIANEYGALTTSTSGQTTTLSGSLDQIVTALESRSSTPFSECALQTIPGGACIKSALMGLLGRVNYSASLDLTQPSTITGTTTGTAPGGTQKLTGTQAQDSFSLSQFTAKFLIWATKPTNQSLINAAKLTAEPSRSALVCLQAGQKQNTKCELMPPSTAWQVWFASAIPALLAASDQEVEKELLNQAKLLTDALVAGADPSANADAGTIVSAALNYSAALAANSSAERTAYEKALWAKPVISAEFDYNTPANQPTNSTFRLIWGQSIKSWNFTANGAGSIYNSTPSSSVPKSERLRDIQIGIEADYNIPKFAKLDASTLGFAYYFQNQTSPAILSVTPSSPVNGVTITGLPSNATQIFTETGPINLGQFKLTLGNAATGIKFPIAITGSNRTELVTKPSVGAQIGISYSFDSLLR